MSNLIECKDCGHTVSRNAKVCPSCGVGKPGVKPTNFGKLFVIALVVFMGGAAYFNYLDETGQLSDYGNPVRSSPAVEPRIYADADIQEAIAKSDDYEIYRAEFTKAATSLLSSRRCGRFEMTQYGGFVKSTTTYKDQPVYFTYCGGSSISNRIYLDVSTGRIFK